MLNTSPTPSFENPLELLRACHGKILRQCETLQRLTEHLEKSGCDAPAQQAAQGILRYFETAGKLHHQDEELDLFPALLAAPDAAALGMEALLQRLLEEHQDMLTAWDAVQPSLTQLAAGQAVTLPADAVRCFIVCHTRHVALENGEVLPLAERLLAAEKLDTLGRAMAARRGVNF